MENAGGERTQSEDECLLEVIRRLSDARNKKSNDTHSQNLLSNKLELTLIKTANKNKKMDL